MRGSWWPDITEIFWPRSYGRQRCVFLVLHGCSTGALESAGRRLSLLHLVHLRLQLYSPELVRRTQLSSVQFVDLILPSNSHAVIWTRLHAAAISSDVSRSGSVTSAIFGMSCVSSSSGNNSHAVQRSLSSGALVYESIMGFFFYLVPFHQPISAHAISSYNCH